MQTLNTKEGGHCWSLPPLKGPSGTTSPLGGAQLVKKFANLILLPGQVTRSLNCPSPLAKNFQQYSNVSRPVKFAQNCKGDVHSPEHELCTSDKKSIFINSFLKKCVQYILYTVYILYMVYIVLKTNESSLRKAPIVL